MSLITLDWLPLTPDWRDRVRAFQGAETPAWANAVQLARARINFSQTNGLDGVVAAGLAAGRIADAPPPLRVAVVGSSTLTHLHAGIRIAGLRRGLRIETMEPDFGQHVQAMLDPASALHAFAPDAVLFAFDAPYLTRGIVAGMSVAEAQAAIDQALDQMAGLWRQARRAFGGLVIQQTAMIAAPALLGGNEHRLAGSQAEATRRINERLRERADVEGVDLLALDAAVAQEGLNAWHSRGQWLRARQEIAPQAAPAYGELVVRLIAARRGLSAKCLVLDLDNTLWGGVVGDDGLSGIILGQGSGEGEAYREIQAHALALAKRGVILAVCSKNDEATVGEAFDSHPDMLIRRTDITCLRANWDDKPSNLAAIAQTLNIGLDSLVFLDDNPVERDLVRQTLPMVAVPEWPGDPALVPRLLADAGYFEGVGVTEEDRTRSTLYAAMAGSASLKAQATDLDSYLRDLRMTLAWSPVGAVGLARATQLINKTNQFNLTTRRYSEEAVRALVADPDAFVLQFRLTDRFVDNGVIAVVIGKRTAPQEVTLDTWLMSCRVLGRQVEAATLDVVVAQARAMGADRIVGEYIATERNGIVADLHSRLGFTPIEGEDGRYFLDVDRHRGDGARMTIVRVEA